MMERNKLSKQKIKDILSGVSDRNQIVINV